MRPRRWIRGASLAGFLALGSACTIAHADARAPNAEPAAPSTVVVISMDGVRHDYLDRMELPALSRMAREGLRAESLVPVFPSSTFPCHVSLATGTFPDTHGIVDNTFWDRERGRFDYENDASWIEAEPVWAAAERQGVTAATFFWVGSETEWRGHAARYRKAPFDSDVGEAEKVAQILAWLDLPPAERPRLVLSWWHGPDRAGHLYGPDHPEVDAALAGQDAYLGRLLRELDARDAWSSTTLLVLSDHGMTTAEHTVPLEATLAAAKVTPRVEAGAAVAHLFFDDAEEVARAETALRQLEGIAVDRRADVPKRLRLVHPTRSGDLVVRAESPHTFRKGGLLARVRDLFGARRGIHGYPPEHPDMHGVFLALGRGAEAGTRIGAVAMTDVAATITALLGIDPPAHSEGEPIEALAGANAREKARD